MSIPLPPREAVRGLGSVVREITRQLGAEVGLAADEDLLAESAIAGAPVLTLAVTGASAAEDETSRLAGAHLGGQIHGSVLSRVRVELQLRIGVSVAGLDGPEMTAAVAEPLAALAIALRVPRSFVLPGGTTAVLHSAAPSPGSTRAGDGEELDLFTGGFLAVLATTVTVAAQTPEVPTP